MNLEELKEITTDTNTILFALAKMINNYCDIIAMTKASGIIGKADILEMLTYDEGKDKITLAKDWRGKVFDLALFPNDNKCAPCDELEQRNNEAAKQTIKKFQWVKK